MHHLHPSKTEEFVKSELVDSILKTVAFFDLFDFPLTAEEIQNYLYKYKQPLHIKELQGTLNHLVEVGQLVFLKNHYLLPHREAILETRKSHKFIAEKFWNRTTLNGQHMRAVPFVKMVAVCNNLAYDNPNENSDIDLFVVVKPGRMWIARLILTIMLHLHGVRRHGKKIAGRFCLSFFVTEEKMSMENFELKPEDPYLAYWTKTLAPIYGKETFEAFRRQNRPWLLSYGLDFTDHQMRHMDVHSEPKFKRFFQWIFNRKLGDFFEFLLQKTLKKKTLKAQKQLGARANVVVSDQVLKFHNIDRRKEYFEHWKKILNS